MAQSFTCVYLHIIFSTQQRLPLIAREKQEKLWSYIGGILKNHRMKGIAIGGMEDHIHVLVSVSSEVSVAKVVNLIKSNSSKWTRVKIPEFGWQKGYAAFSVSVSAVESVKKYIDTQAEHHKKRDFKQEYLALLKKHGVEYDPKWVFD
ncbi:MAG: IS200/IS605 family transposase [Candidatus Koribacter versatilis]|uniref:IS200/IS605 family transposase n=1 Tax=Candidatus Korobacter versatilis TaxID=658062 RepID=A0A932A9Z3_9BACT|nr:IS200/IS605 family transposase [Candidatus Koribacter versatilis]